MNRIANCRLMFWIVFLFVGSRLAFGRDGDFSKIIKEVIPSLVLVRSQKAHNQPSPHVDVVTGTGMIISNDGYIFTNAHVVTYQDSFVRFNKTEVLLYKGKYIEAKVIGVDPENDLALLKIDTPPQWLPLKAVKLEKDPKQISGKMVVKGGFPVVVVSENPTFAHGFITNERTFLEDYSTPYYILDFRVSKGDSGGPVLNSKGRIIAISSKIFITNESVSLLVPAYIVNRVLPKLYKGDKRTGWLGVNPSHCLDIEDALRDDDLKEKTAENLKKYGVSLSSLLQGIVIMAFADQTVGDAKLLRIGDTITKVNGKIPQDKREFVQWIAEQEPGSEVELAIVRGNQPLVLKLKVGEFKWRVIIEEARLSDHKL